MELDSGCRERVREQAERAHKRFGTDFLTFDGRFEMSSRSFVKMKVHTVDLKALVRLGKLFTTSRAVPGGFLKLEHPEILLERMVKLGIDFKRRHLTMLVPATTKSEGPCKTSLAYQVLYGTIDEDSDRIPRAERLEHEFFNVTLTLAKERGGLIMNSNCPARA